jgi:large subunit ribosomal protein L19
MALKAKFKDKEFGVGDTVRIIQKVKEGDKERKQAFEGLVIGIKGRGETKTFTVRRMGVGQIGIERIFPLNTPTIEDVEIVREGTEGVRRAKLYYTRGKPKKIIDEIYSRAARRGQKEEVKKAKKSKKSTKTSKKK